MVFSLYPNQKESSAQGRGRDQRGWPYAFARPLARHYGKGRYSAHHLRIKI